MNKTIILAVIVVAIFGSYYISQKLAPTPEKITNIPVLNTYTYEDVAKHSVETDCWSAINGKVYDITKMIAVHKGGQEKIMTICGKDGTEGFTAMHGSNNKVVGLLNSLQIGQIK